jgi:glucose/arabinose dehydrogenase
MFPKECHNAIFITRHGLWNRSKKIGADVIVARFNPGAVKSIEPFITGFIQGANYVGRPVDIEWLRDGSTLLSDDFNEINTALPGAGDETVTNCKKSQTSPDDRGVLDPPALSAFQI